MFQKVQAEKAVLVLIFSDLFTDSSLTTIFERALVLSEFEGPILNFSIHKSIFLPKTGEKQYSVASSSDKTITKRHGVLSLSATHSFEVDSDDVNGHTRVAMAVATTIAGVLQEDGRSEEVEKIRNRRSGSF
jgi:hypothetical protein